MAPNLSIAFASLLIPSSSLVPSLASISSSDSSLPSRPWTATAASEEETPVSPPPASATGTPAARQSAATGSVRLNDLRFLRLVLLLQGIDPVLTLHIRPAPLLRVAVKLVNGVRHILPVLMPEIPPIKLHKPPPPSVHERGRRLLAPTILTERQRPRRRRRRRQRIRHLPHRWIEIGEEKQPRID
nr:hypothetical protein PanWU01x14_030050 [Ipomoea batatas]